MKKKFLASCIGVLVAMLLAAGAGVFLYLSIITPTLAPPSFDQARQSYRRSDAVLLDRHHEVIHELRVDQKARRLDWIPLEDISPALTSSIIAAEDRRFYEHAGVDWRAIGAVLLHRLSADSLRGASTITMQLASKLNRELQPKNTHRSLWQKWLQMSAAHELERRWTKAQILEAYLNLVTFRGELQGIAAASRGLMDKQPHGLDDRESVILASLVRAPNAPMEQVAARACLLADAMNLRLACPEVASKTKEVLSVPYTVQPEIALAPHVAARLLEPYRGKTNGSATQVVSTLDGRLQRFAIETLQRQILSVRDQNVHDGAVLVLENKTGDVLAYVGNVGEQASARFVDGTQAVRQAGSILKPFLYGTAIDERLLTAASLIDDSPVDVPEVTGIYRPENYDNRFHGLVTARTALASSLNIPAVKTLLLVGVERFVDKLNSLEFRGLHDADYYGPSLALGTSDIALWDLTNAYRSLANGGVWSPARLTFDEKSSSPMHRTFSPEAAFIISDILSDRESRSRTFDLESPLSTRFWTAVKTGTSKDMRDNWCVGFSGRYTVGVWVGNFSGQPMWNVSGITGAAPVWVEIMNWLHHDEPSFAPRPPAGVTPRTVTFADSDQGRHEWFLKGTETAAVRAAARSANFRIVYPANGTIIALDPDIPEDQQKVFFESQPADNNLRWALDGTEVGSAGSVLPWSPTRGKHTLVLVDAGQHVLDSVTFVVRGSLSAASDIVRDR
jgi:penicillin-binding protein 1C